MPGDTVAVWISETQGRDSFFVCAKRLRIDEDEGHSAMAAISASFSQDSATHYVCPTFA